MQEVLSTQHWAISPEFFNRMHPLFMQALTQGRDIMPLLKSASGRGYAMDDNYADGSDSPPPKAVQISANITMEWDREFEGRVYVLENGNRVARVPMIGALSKYGGMCSYGSKELAGMIQRANTMKSIKGIVGYVDGPGGSVSGTPALGNAIRMSDKPFVAYVDEWAASAHYWVASQSAYIMGNVEEYTEVGSIGVLCGLMNFTEWLQKEGIDYKVMRAEQSVDKALLNEVEPWPKASLEELQAELNSIADDFIAAVKDGRGARLKPGSEDIFTGKMYPLDDAISMGMVDYKGTLADAIELTADVAETRSKKSIAVT